MHEQADGASASAARMAETLDRVRQMNSPDLGADEFEAEEEEEAMDAVYQRHPWLRRRKLEDERLRAEAADAARAEQAQRAERLEAAQREKRRTKVTSAHVLLTVWCRDAAEWRRFAVADFAPASTGRSVQHKEWRPEPDWDAADGYVRRFRYVHTCRNAGNWRSDAEKFVRGALRRSGQTDEEVQVHVELIRD